ncbi:OTU-like cysteine protease [Medicago truncatula]|uniref:OTU-like cysteine protease n=1 Tax=Medicago truncatula TaxID=3880 RepID=G7KAR3_MEDTR|nr:OTU-like cysteine protease [Medicago truncatula]
MEPALEGHILAGRLKEDDKKIVCDLTKRKMLPRNILIHLKNQRPHCMTNVKQVYNERQQIWKANRGDKKPLQFLISKLEEHIYTYYSRTQLESNTIEDIFWAHPTSIKLFNNFPTVLVMDSTYKTNMYRMPMFEVVGVTSTDLTYSVGFRFMTHEKEENFDGKEVSNRDVVKKIMKAWKAMVESPTQRLYANALVEFKDSCSDFPISVDYAMTTLNEVKEKIVRAWTDHVLHLGCRTTNRVESAHALLKKYLDNSVGDLGTCWEKIHDMLLLQFTAIQTSFGHSVCVLEHRFKDVTLYSGLGGHVSRYALDNIALEETRCRETLCMDNDICGCVQRTSYGLPCACEIATKLLQEKPILLDEIYHHWLRLSMGEESNEVAFCVEVELKAIVERLKKLPFQMKLEVKEGLRQLAFPETTLMSPPPRKEPTKGAKKKVDIARSKGKITSTSRIPSSWEVVDSQNSDSQPSPSPTSSYKRKKSARLVVDVIGDGHCGFRAIAKFMGLTEKNHLMIRTHLIQELIDHRDDYVEVFAGEDRYNYILNGLHPPANTKTCAHLVDKWLTFPDMGHIVANYYKMCVVVLINLEVGNSESFFPLRGPPPPGNQKTPILCLGEIPNHFVLISLKNGCPLHPSSTEWHNHKKEDAVTWEDEYLDQHELFRKLMAIESGNKPSKPQKESNKAAPILLDTPEKPKQQFEVIAEDEEDSMSLDLLQSLGL